MLLANQLPAYPRLRGMLNAQPIEYAGGRYILLRDLLELSNGYILVPQSLAPLLPLMDGTRDLDWLRATLAIQFGTQVPEAEINKLVAALEDAYLLDTPRFRVAEQNLLAVYRSAPFRNPSCAPHVYPDEPAALRDQLDGYLAGNGDLSISPLADVRGLVSPHIDYARGGQVYARVWEAAAQAAREADLVVIFGTDHNGADPITLTRQHYATPYGVLPTAHAAVDHLANALGEEAAFKGELRHRQEHSVELAAVWLHHMRAGQPVELIPVLCGQLDGLPAASSTHKPAPQGSGVEKFLLALEAIMRDQKTLVVAAGDLAHVGPAFGGAPLDDPERELVQAADERLLDMLQAGTPAAFWDEIRLSADRFNVCGTVPICLTLQALDPTRGVRQAYASCPADQADTSAVTICGITLH